MPEFDEIFAGECEGMRYEDIRRERPEVAKARAEDKYGYAYPGGESYALLSGRVRRGLARALFLAGDEALLVVGHQAINRVVLSLFLNQRNEDVPYLYIPQNQYYHISVTPRRKLFELIKFA
jgi:broad specificity phosphatase PhoE